MSTSLMCGTRCKPIARRVDGERAFDFNEFRGRGDGRGGRGVYNDALGRAPS
jgi:hypothetical protein